MISLGPFPLSLVVLLLAFAIAVAVAWNVARLPAQASIKVMPTLLDMLFVGVIAARVGFVLQWLPEYLTDPWSIIRIGDGGFSVWAGVLAGLAFGTWRARKLKPLRRPLALGVLAGLVSWAALGGALALMQQSTLKLPTTELATLDRRTTRLSAISGKPMVVNLWATWCPPCRREMPVLAQAQARRGDVTFAFVNQGEPETVIRDYLRGEDIQLQNVLLDLFSSVSQQSGSRGLPTTLFFNAQGRLVDTHMGELSEASLSRKLQQFGLAPSLKPDPSPSKKVN
ncbi:MAG: TlpA disulfide reductase family protein [Pseudoxanthomonas sp.]